MLNPKNLYRSLKVAVIIILLIHCSAAKASLSGTYTINKSAAASSSNYKNIASAVSDLLNGTRSDGGAANDKGVSGAVIFSIADGTYNEQINITSAISGISATNTIIFKSASGDYKKVSVSYGGTVVSIVNNSYITFNELEITNTADASATVSFDNCGYITVSSCSITGTLKTKQLIYDNESLGNNTYSDNIMSNAGIAIYAVSSDNSLSGGSITGNTVKGVSQGIVMKNFASVNIESNNIKSDRKASPSPAVYNVSNSFTFVISETAGIELFGFHKAMIISNNIVNVMAYDKGGKGIALVSDSSEAASPSIVFNNMVSVQNDIIVNSAMALSIQYSSNIRIAFNNLLTSGVNTNSYFFNLTDVPNHVVDIEFCLNQPIYMYNNNIVSYSGAINLFTYIHPDLHSDYNNFLTYNSNGGYPEILIDTAFGGFFANYYSLANWTKATGNDSHSVSVYPVYLSTTDLHISAAGLYHAGTSIYNINKDIDGVARNSSPSIGANEFTPGNWDAGILPESRLSTGCGDSTTIFLYAVANFGKKEIDTVIIGLKDLSNNKIYTDTVVVGLLPGRVSNYMSFNNATLNTYAGGIVKYKIFTMLPQDTDRRNDTSTITQRFSRKLFTPSVTEYERCDEGPVTINLKSNKGQYNVWSIVDPSTGGYKRIAEGNTLQTTATDTMKQFFIHMSILGYNSVGAKDTTGLKGYYSNISQKSVIYTPAPSYIDTVTVYPQSRGSFVIRVYNKNNLNLDYHSKTVNVSVSHAGQAVKVPLNWSVYQGGYVLEVDSMTTSLYTADLQEQFAYYTNSDSSVIMQTKQHTIFKYPYPYLFDVRVAVDQCGGDWNISVHKTIFQASYNKDAYFQGIFSNGTSSSPDTICTGNKAIYDLGVSPLFSPYDYGTKWLVDSFSVTAPHGYISKNTSTSLNTFPNSVTFEPQQSEGDSLYRIRIRIRRLVSGCDTFINRYVYVRSATTSSFNAPSMACSGDTIKFTNTSTGGSSSYWNFGDNSTSIQTDPIHVYSVSNSDSIQFEVNMASGSGTCASAAKRSITVYRVPSANFTLKNDSNGKIEFKPADSMASATYSWNFGDGSTSSVFKPTHTFAKNGTYKITLTTKNKLSCGKTFDTTIVLKHIGLAEAVTENENITVYPNPARNMLNVTYSLPEAGIISFYITDESGRRILGIREGMQASGSHSAQINLPESIAAGTYFLNLVVNDKVTTRQLMIAK